MSASHQPQLITHEFGPPAGFPILFLHGWSLNGKSDAFDFEPVLRKYDTSINTTYSYRRIYLDLPAHGHSPPLAIHSLDDILTHICHFIDTRFLPTQQHFLLAGTSAGGYLAQAIAQRYASLIDGLLLRVPLVEPDNARRDIDAFVPLVRDEVVMRGLSEKEKASWGGEVLVQTDEYVGLLRRKWEEGILPALGEGNQGVLAGVRGDVGRYTLTELSDDGAREKGKEERKFEAPTLVINGRQDGVTGYRDSLRLLELYTRSTFVVLDRTGHDLPVDQGGVFEALVGDWLGRVVERQRGVR